MKDKKVGESGLSGFGQNSGKAAIGRVSQLSGFASAPLTWEQTSHGRHDAR